MHDRRMKMPDKPVPFDMNRMIFGGFDVIYDSGAFGFVDGMVAMVPSDSHEDFAAFAESHGALFKEKSALRVIDGWGTDVAKGKVTDFLRTFVLAENQTFVF